MYLCVRGIDFASFYSTMLIIDILDYSDSGVFFCFLLY